MFDTLVCTDSDCETLEYIENPDPAIALSRNVHDNIRVACLQCRSKKVRCSGERERCKKCASIGLDCVYPKNQGRSKPQGQKKKPSGIQYNANVPIRIECDEIEPCAREGPLEYGQGLTLDNLNEDSFDDSCIDDSLFTSWIMHTPMQHSSDDRSSLSRSRNPAPADEVTKSKPYSSETSRSTTAVLLDQLPESSTPGASLASLLGLSTEGSADDLGSWEKPQMTHGDISWAMNDDGRSRINSTTKPPSLEPLGKTRSESDGCCLLSSVYFLERLSSKSASRKTRVDLLLSEVRNSIETLENFISCEGCAPRIEQNMLLAMAARQIGVTCENMANCYRAIYLCLLDDTTAPQQKLHVDRSAALVEISVSGYRVNRRERLHLLERLVTLQINEFQRHISTIKSR